MKVPFINTFVLAVDTVIYKHYGSPVQREDYLLMLHSILQRLSMFKHKNDYFNTCEISNHNERLCWGRVKVDGKLVWKIDIILNNLVNTGVLNRTGYEVKGHARRYGFTDQFLNMVDLMDFTIMYEEVNEAIYNTLKSLKEYDESNPQYQLLKSSRFTIDVESCVDYLRNSLKKKEMSMNAFNVNLKRVLDIYNKDIFVVRIDNGRVYSSFTSLKSELRQYCFIDGEPLTSIDLRSSQPYFLASLLMSSNSNDKDVNEFYTMVVNGDIYEWIMGKLGMKSRALAKEEMFRWIFKKSNKGPCVVQKLMADNLPGVHKAVTIQRAYYQHTGGTLANFLQSLESKVFITVCEEFGEEGCISLHDGLYFKEEILDRVVGMLHLMFAEMRFSDYTLKVDRPAPGLLGSECASRPV